MKFKKRQILFDNKVAYNFEKTEGKGLTGNRAFAMTTVAGDTILTFKPVSLSFDILPFEEEATHFKTYHEMKLHEKGESIPVDYSPLGLPNRAFQHLRTSNMLTFDGMDYDQLDAFVKLMGSAQEIIDDHQQENSNRLAHYERTVAKYGEAAYTKRSGTHVNLTGDKFQLGKTTIGRWVEVGKRVDDIKWKDKHKDREYVLYMIKNRNGNDIAELHVRLGENKVAVLPIVDDERHELKFIPTLVATKATDLIKLAAEKLVVLGYL